MSTNEIKQPWLSNDAFLRWARPIFHALYNTWVMTGPPPPTKRIHLDENGMTPASDQETMKCVPWEEDEPEYNPSDTRYGLNGMTDEETKAYLLQWCEDEKADPYGVFCWPTDGCGYYQHMRFVEYRNAHWRDDVGWKNDPHAWIDFVRNYALSLATDDEPEHDPGEPDGGRRPPMDRIEMDCLKRSLLQHADPRSGDDDHSVAMEALECIEDLEQQYADVKRRIDKVRELLRFRASEASDEDGGIVPDKSGEWIYREDVLETLALDADKEAI